MWYRQNVSWSNTRVWAACCRTARYRRHVVCGITRCCRCTCGIVAITAWCSWQISGFSPRKISLTEHPRIVLHNSGGCESIYSCASCGCLQVGCLQVGKVKSSPRHYALGSHEGLYGQCLNRVSVVRSNLECSYTDSPGRDTSPPQVPSKQCLYSFAAEWTEAK